MDDHLMSDTMETQLQRQELNPPPMNATLDDDEDVDEADDPGSVMMSYLHHVHVRLQQEVSSNSGTTNWLLHLLKQDGFGPPSIVGGVSFSPSSVEQNFKK